MSTWVIVGASSFSAQSFMRLLREKKQSVLQASLRDGAEAAFKLVEESRAQFVVNFAALNMVGESWEHCTDYYRVNIVETAKLTTALSTLTNDPPRYVNVSTPEVYGLMATHLPLRETDHFIPSTPYAVSRAANDMHVATLFKERGFDAVTTRTVNVYGPQQQLYRIIPRTIMSVLLKSKLPLQGGGRSQRSFIHIDDQARAMYLIARFGRAGETYHSATMPLISIRDLVQTICSMMSAKLEDIVHEVPDRAGKDPAYLLNDEKLRTELRWRDEISLNDGLKETVGWYVEHFDELKDRALEYTHRR